jgi:hypothetical protein
MCDQNLSIRALFFLVKEPANVWSPECTEIQMRGGDAPDSERAEDAPASVLRVCVQ